MSASLLALGLLALVFNLGGGLIAPAVPLYARSLGADYRDLGLIGASHGLAFAALTVPLGRLSDRLGRRTLLLAAALTVGGAALLYVAAGQVATLVAAKFLEAVGWAAFWPALEAWAAEQFRGRAGTAMGVGYAAYAAAFVVGSSAAGFLMEAAGLRAPFAAYLATSAATALLVLRLRDTRAERAPGAAGGGAAAPRVPAPAPGRAAAAPGAGPGGAAPDAAGAPGPGDRAAAGAGIPGPAGGRAAGRTARRLAYGTGFVYVYGLGTVLAFLPVYAADRGLGPRGVGLVVGLYWLARFAGSLWAGRLSDRVGRRAVLLPAMGAASAAAALLAAPAGPAGLALGALGLGLTAGACAPACIGLIADHVPPADRGLAMGLFEASCGVSIFLAGLAGGYGARALGPGTPYVLAAGLAAAWAVVLARHLPAPPASRTA